MGKVTGGGGRVLLGVRKAGVGERSYHWHHSRDGSAVSSLEVRVNTVTMTFARTRPKLTTVGTRHEAQDVSQSGMREDQGTTPYRTPYIALATYYIAVG